MNKFNLGIITVFILVLGTLLSGLSFAKSVPIANLSLQLNGIELSPNSVNRLNVLKGDNLRLRLSFDATGNMSNVEFLATIFGYEYNQYHSLTSESAVFNILTNVTYVKYLTLKLPDDIKNGNFKLRIYVADPYDNGKTYEYNLLINSPRHDVKILDVLLSPNYKITAGSYLISRIRIKNDGLMNENNVKAQISIPALGISQEDYIDSIKPGDFASTNDMALRIPDCTSPKDYKIYATVTYNNGYSNVTTVKSIDVLKSGTCELTTQPKVGKTIISVPESVKKAKSGQTVVYSMNLMNTGSVSKTFNIETENSDWATVTFNPSNLVVLGGQGTNTLTISVTPKKNLVPGDHVLFVVLKSQGNIVQQIPLTLTLIANSTNKTGNQTSANVTNKSTTPGLTSLRTGLEITIVILVIVLIIIALIVGFSRGKQNEENNDEETKTYY